MVDLTRELRVPHSTVATHAACLRDCGLVRGGVEGRQVFYAPRHIELLDLLRAARTLLEATGEAVLLCPTYGERAAEQLPEGRRR